MIQKIESIVRSIYYTGIATVFIKSKHVLSKEISKASDFASLNLTVTSDEKKVAHAIILHLYKSNTQIHREKQLGLYHKIDLTVLWFINTIGCRRRLIFACSMQASTFTISCLFDYCNNYIYKVDWNGDVSVYNIHDITAKQFICYFDSEDWENQEILVEYNWLVAQQAHQTLDQTFNNKQTIYR